MWQFQPRSVAFPSCYRQLQVSKRSPENLSLSTLKYPTDNKKTFWISCWKCLVHLHIKSICFWYLVSSLLRVFTDHQICTRLSVIPATQSMSTAGNWIPCKGPFRPTQYKCGREAAKKKWHERASGSGGIRLIGGLRTKERENRIAYVLCVCVCIFERQHRIMEKGRWPRAHLFPWVSNTASGKPLRHSSWVGSFGQACHTSPVTLSIQ